MHKGAYRGQKKVMDALELELQVVVSHHLGAENESGSSLREVSALTIETSLQTRKSSF